MELAVSVVTVVIPSVLTLIGCLINNNVQRTKEQHAIESQIAKLDSKYDKTTSLIEQKISELSIHVNQHNNLIERMYNVESLTVRLGDMQKQLDERIDRLEVDHR